MKLHAKFKTPINIDVHTETELGDIITVREPLLTCWKGRYIYVPAWFQSDGFSVPRLFWGSVSPRIHPCTLRAAICHDLIYRLQPEGWTRADADNMLYDFCREDGFGFLRSSLAYAGVKLGGGTAWRKAAAKLNENK